MRATIDLRRHTNIYADDATRPMSARPRLSEYFDRKREYVTDAALRLNDARHAGVDFKFAPQAEHLHIDAAIEDVFVNAGRL